MPLLKNWRQLRGKQLNSSTVTIDNVFLGNRRSFAELSNILTLMILRAILNCCNTQFVRNKWSIVYLVVIGSVACGLRHNTLHVVRNTMQPYPVAFHSNFTKRKCLIYLPCIYEWTTHNFAHRWPTSRTWTRPSTGIFRQAPVAFRRKAKELTSMAYTG